MPTPDSGETRDDFLGRCMGDSRMVDEFPDGSQRAAVCHSKWNEAKKGDISGADLQSSGAVKPPSPGGRRCPPGYVFSISENSCVPQTRPATRVQILRALVPVFYTEEERAERSILIIRAGTGKLGNRQTRGHQDPFLRDELSIAKAINRRAIAVSSEVEGVYERAWKDPFSEEVFQDATRDAQDAWQAVWDEELNKKVSRVLSTTIDRGERALGSPGALSGTPSRQVVLDGMVDASKYYTNEFFNTQVMPQLQAAVRNMFDGTTATGTPDFNAIRAMLDRRLKSTPYWRVVANSAASRSYHYGVLKTASFQGQRTYTFRAVIDDRTSDICRTLNGRRWYVADALALVERAAQSGSVSEMKTLLPWVSSDQIAGMDENALRDLGVLIPPLHANCRSTIVTG